LRKMVLLWWGVGAVGAGSAPGGAFGVLRLGEGRVRSRDCVGRGKVHIKIPRNRLKPLPAAPLVVCQRYLIVAPKAVDSGDARCASQILDRGAQAVESLP
jgi:hypothetical protein